MSSESVTTASPSPSPPSSLWDRISTWASENKAVVYGIAGTAVVITGAGVVYYLSGSINNKNSASTSAEKRKSKKERRKEKKLAAAEEGRGGIVDNKDEKAGIFIESSALPAVGH